ncbi:hypothetical protein NJG16_01245 [Stenotrophomonas maltophilia]|uniref:hypothetical protein n=1 Tax=Stenotrophomonas lactitubi TaxID=2045214 RepID=UPI0020414641|nr:hypothetical protein [Stenotrophomonas lactitubi]MCO7468691.1 hypothetical protein [Stenotrophomonas maltophilia]
MRKTLIFGNGLGMALDPEFFSLDNAIGRAWDGEGVFNEETRALVRCCLVDDGDTERPHAEEDLDSLQLVVSSCDFLAHMGRGGAHWLSEHGQRFPAAVRKFLYHTALELHQRDMALPMEFAAPLAAFLHESRSHVATLNYDNLLYQRMIEARVLDGYGGALVDGLLSSGFSAENLERKWGRTFGYYMHLHGSPLFVDQDGVVVKLTQGALGSDEDVVGSHIVLTHVKHKPTVIAASALLQSYWEHLEKALAESCEVLLFGYSGLDVHLNELLERRAPDKIRVVEWEGAGTSEDRQAFWNRQFGKDVAITRMGNILEFVDWT